MPKILYASQKLHVPMSEGGGEVIAFDLFSEIHQQKKADVQAVGSFKYIDLPNLNKHLCEAKTELILNQTGCDLITLNNNKLTVPGFTHIEYSLPNSYRTTLARDDHYQISFSEFIGQFQPDHCLLQAEGAVQSWVKLKDNPNVKTYLYVQNGLEPTNFKANKLAIPTCLSNSKFIQSMIKEKHGIESHLLYPAINIERYKTHHLPKQEREKFTVLFINPNQVKGLHIFLQLAKAFPNIHFKMLEGWVPIEAGLQQFAKQIGNIECVNRTWNMAEVYHSADLLVAPSQWEEAFGRVIIEAHAAGLPTLASKIGGLPESSGEAGLLVEDFTNYSAWIEQFKLIVENKSILDEKRPLLMANATRFSPKNSADEFLRITNLS